MLLTINNKSVCDRVAKVKEMKSLGVDMEFSEEEETAPEKRTPPCQGISAAAGRARYHLLVSNLLNNMR